MNSRESGLGAGDSTERMKRAPSPEPRAPRRLPRQVQLFGWVSLLNDFASEMIYPLLPAFVTGVLGAGPQALGALDGAAEFAAAFVKLGAGRLADRVPWRSEEHTSELQSRLHLVCRLLLEKKKTTIQTLRCIAVLHA